MTAPVWLKPADCLLLHGAEEDADPVALRLLQRLLEIPLVRLGAEEVGKAALEEIARATQAEQAIVLAALPNWPVTFAFGRRGQRGADTTPRALLSEVVDRESAVALPPSRQGEGSPALVAVCCGYREKAHRVLVVTRPREAWQRNELEYLLAAGYYLGLALDAGQLFDAQRETSQRLKALVAIGQQLVEQRETVPLLEHIAEQAVKLLNCERASIFLWDKARQELVGRPALGLPNGELRLSDHVGVVGKTLQTGLAQQVDDVHADPAWSAKVDSESGFRTRNLLCVPMKDAAGERVGVLEVMNKKQGNFTALDLETLTALASQTTAAVLNVRERESLLRSNAELEGQARKGARLVGESTAIKALRDSVQRVARTDLPVLILGESGSGKDVVARAIHYSGPRQPQPFIPVNCAAIAETLLESELFGHEKGAFTGADSTRAGKFEAASGGTLFLDEIGDLSAGGQAKLLRVLEEKAVYRVGGHQPIPVDVRIIAATNRNLAESVRAGKFREDLFYRLTVVTLELLPLRERRDDILVLAEHFLQLFSRDAGRKSLKLSPEARKKLEQHNWPGNVRELRNLIERVAYLSPGERVEVDDLAIIARPSAGAAHDPFADMSLKDATEQFQKEHIQRTIARAQNNMSEVAKLLGLHRPNLYRKMRDLGMDN